MNYFLRVTFAVRREAVAEGEMGGQGVHAAAGFMGVFDGVAVLGRAGNWRKTSNFKRQFSEKFAKLEVFGRFIG